MRKSKGRVPLMLEPLRKLPGEDPRVFAERAVAQLMRNLEQRKKAR